MVQAAHNTNSSRSSKAAAGRKNMSEAEQDLERKHNGLRNWVVLLSITTLLLGIMQILDFRNIAHVKNEITALRDSLRTLDAAVASMQVVNAQTRAIVLATQAFARDTLAKKVVKVGSSVAAVRSDVAGIKGNETGFVTQGDADSIAMKHANVVWGRLVSFKSEVADSLDAHRQFMAMMQQSDDNRWFGEAGARDSLRLAINHRLGRLESREKWGFVFHGVNLVWNGINTSRNR